MTVVRSGRLMRWLGGIPGFIMVEKTYRYESGSGLEMCENRVRSHNCGRR